jgi:hypothetical protein
MARRNYKRRRAKPSSWKKLRLSKKIKHRLKIFGLAFVVVLATAVVSGTVALYHFFSQPMAAATGATDGDITFPGGRFNLLMIVLEDASEPTSLAKEIAVITLNVNESEVWVVKLPLAAEVTVPQGFGNHQLKEIYSLGALTKPQANLDLTALTVKRHLAVPIDGYLVTDDAGLGRIDQYLGGGWRVLRLLPNLLNEVRRQIKTNLSFPSLLRIGQFVWSVRSDEDVWAVSPEELADWQHLDLELQKHFADPKIMEERLKIQILNATDKPGLATHVARYVENLGGEVIIIGNADQTDLRQSFLVTGQKESHTVGRLAEVLQIDEVRRPEADRPLDEISERADLTIILGLDSWKNL